MSRRKLYTEPPTGSHDVVFRLSIPEEPERLDVVQAMIEGAAHCGVLADPEFASALTRHHAWSVACAACNARCAITVETWGPFQAQRASAFNPMFPDPVMAVFRLQGWRDVVEHVNGGTRGTWFCSGRCLAAGGGR